MIFIISRNEGLARTAREIFFGMGYVAETASPEEAASRLSPLHRAVLALGRDVTSDRRSFVRQIRSSAGDIPVFAVREDVDPENYEVFDKVYPNSVYSSRVARELTLTSLTRGLRPIGKYALAGIDADVDAKEVTYCGAPIGLTKTETMILRYLLCIYPSGARIDDILEFAFRSGRAPTEAGVRTHICSINRKFETLTDKPLISSAEGAYVLTTPERTDVGEPAIIC